MSEKIKISKGSDSTFFYFLWNFAHVISLVMATKNNLKIVFFSESVDLKKIKQKQNQKDPLTGFKALLRTTYAQSFREK